MQPKTLNMSEPRLAYPPKSLFPSLLHPPSGRIVIALNSVDVCLEFEFRASGQESRSSGQACFRIKVGALMMFSPVGTLRPSGQSDEEKFYVSILEPYFGIDSRVLFLGLFLKYCGLSQDLQSYEYSRLFVITSFHNECSTSLVRGIRELRLD